MKKRFGYFTNSCENPAYARAFREVISILLIADKIQRAIESGQFSCGTFLDLRKAFDTVDHDILLAKLHSYGIRGTPYDWFVSYLSNRSQFVSIGDTTSSSAVISCGGSVLGPLLFF